MRTADKLIIVTLLRDFDGSKRQLLHPDSTEHGHLPRKPRLQGTGFRSTARVPGQKHVDRAVYGSADGPGLYRVDHA